MTNIAPTTSLKPIISFVSIDAENMPTTTSKARSKLILPGSSTSTLKKVSKIEGKSQIKEKNNIHTIISIEKNKFK